jgi:hypothetical protein
VVFVLLICYCIIFCSRLFPFLILFAGLAQVQHALQEAKLGHTPTIYWISPAAAPLLATATCSVEWLGEKQQRRVFQPKPPFPHEEMMKKGQLVVGAALSTPHIQVDPLQKRSVRECQQNEAFYRNE